MGSNAMKQGKLASLKKLLDNWLKDTPIKVAGSRRKLALLLVLVNSIIVSFVSHLLEVAGPQNLICIAIIGGCCAYYMFSDHSDQPTDQ